MTPEQIELFKQHKCPLCGAPMLLFRTIFMKGCPDCYTRFEWPLKEDQPPLIKHQR
jgi:protein-arginine kinase activator protein McsA